MSFITSPGVIVPPLTAGGVAYGTGSQAKMNNAGTAGQVLTSAGASVPVWGSAGFTLGTPVNASGTAVVFTGIPANTKQVIISFNIVKSGSASHKFIQLGDSSGFIVTGYLSGEVFLTSGLTVQTDQVFTGFREQAGVDSGAALSGSLILTLLDPTTFIWAAVGAFSHGSTGKASTLISGIVTLTSALTQIRATMNGVLTFNGGSINIAYT